MKLICSIYKGDKLDEVYLYVDKQEGLSRVPKSLLEQFGTPVLAMTLVLNENRILARADTANVIASIQENGYFLQMPPGAGEESYMTKLHKQNDKAAQ